MFLFGCLVVLLCIWKTYNFIHVQIKRLQLSAIPQPPLDSIFSGHEPSVNKAKDENRFLDLFVEWVGVYGTTVLFHLGPRSFVFIADPDMLKQLSTDLTSFMKVNNLPNRCLFGQKLIGTKSILSGGGLQWAVKRKMVIQFFAKANIKQLYSVCKPHMEGQQLTRWKDMVKKGQTIELHDQLSITFSSYLQVLGLDKFISPEAIASNVYKLLDAIPKQLFQRYSYLISSEKNEMYQLIKKMRSDAKQVVTDRYEEMCNSPDETLSQMDMLGHLIEANKSVNGREVQGAYAIIELVIDDIITVCLVMDNMVKQLCALFMFLNDCPEIQEKMFTELRETPIDTLEDLNSLKYTEQCLLESLRMGPALLRGTRNFKTGNNNRFGAYVVNTKHVRVHFSEYVMQMNPAYWPNPEKFDPERWQPGFDNPVPFSYMPFFVGARGCVGKHMAMMMMKLTLSVLAKNFDLKQQFDAKRPPIINQNMAVMRIINKVDCYMKPVNHDQNSNE